MRRGRIEGGICGVGQERATSGGRNPVAGAGLGGGDGRYHRAVGSASRRRPAGQGGGRAKIQPAGATPPRPLSSYEARLVPSRATSAATATREGTSSLVKIFERCLSTVFTLRWSEPAI